MVTSSNQVVPVLLSLIRLTRTSAAPRGGFAVTVSFVQSCVPVTDVVHGEPTTCHWLPLYQYKPITFLPVASLVLIQPVSV